VRLDAATLARLRALVPADDAPVRVAPAPLRRLGPVARVTAIGSGRVLRSEPANIFRVLGRHPSLFRAWLRYSGKLMPRGTLPRVDAELVILRVAWRTGAAYEWHQHVLLGARAGLSAVEIERAASSDDVAGWTPRQEMLVRATDELLATSRLTDATWAAVGRELDTRGAIELCVLIGQYQGLATALGGLGVQIERGRAG
jgi:alkylhydroperoxidase family enzyme